MSLILKQETSGAVPTPTAGKGTIFLNASNQIAVKDSSGSTSTVPTVATSNTQVVYNNAGSLDGSNNFVFDNTTNTVTVQNLTVSNTLIAGDIAVSSIANGTSNVDIVGVSGNITISVAGNANILTATGTGVVVAGTLQSTGNANLANLITTEANVTGNLDIGGNLDVVGMVASNLIPSADVTYDLGNSTNRWNNLYLAGNTIYLGNTSLSSGTGNALAVSDMDVSGNITVGNMYANTGTIGANLFTGTLTTSAQPNITSVGTLASLSVTGNANVGNIGATNGIFTNVSGNGSSLSSITGANVTGEVSFAATANAVAGANVSGQVGNALVAGTVYTNSQPNITSVGTLSSLSVTGDVTSGNVYANSGTVRGSLLTGTLTTASQPNITSVGTLASLTATGNIEGNNLGATHKITAGNGLQVTTGPLQILAGNLDVTGNVNVTGNLNYSNVTDLVVGDPLIYVGANNTGDLYDLGIVASYNNGTYYHTGIARNAATDYWTFFDGVVAEPTTVIDWANATYPTVKLGNLIATGNGNLAGLTVSNASGVVNFTTTSNVSLGSIANLHITGGTNGQYLTTDGAGNLSFGTVSTTISITNDTSTNATYYPALTTATSGSIGAANVSSTKLYFNPSTGQLSATDFNSLSDISFKTNVEPIVNGMVVVANIEPVSFNWIDNGRKAYGVIAQEIEKIIPDIVTTNTDGIKTVSYDQIIPFLISAIQDLNKQIQELKNK